MASFRHYQVGNEQWLLYVNQLVLLKHDGAAETTVTTITEARAVRGW